MTRRRSGVRFPHGPPPPRPLTCSFDCRSVAFSGLGTAVNGGTQRAELAGAIRSRNADKWAGSGGSGLHELRAGGLRGFRRREGSARHHINRSHDLDVHDHVDFDHVDHHEHDDDGSAHDHDGRTDDDRSTSSSSSSADDDIHAGLRESVQPWFPP